MTGSSVHVSQDTGAADNLLRLAVLRVLTATRAKFIQFHAPRVVAAVLLGGVIAFLTLRASQGDYRTNVFLRCHNFFFSAPPNWGGATPLLEAISKMRGFGVYAQALPAHTPQLTIFEMSINPRSW
jgi:hypothetical protein